MICLECGFETKAINHTHLQRCSGLSVREYREKYPKTPLRNKYIKGSSKTLGKHTNRSNQKRLLAERNRVDYTGQTHGYLTAVRFLGMSNHKNGHASAIWLFKCQCGNEVERQASHVLFVDKNKRRPRPSVPSCGCRLTAKKLTPGESGFRATMRYYNLGSKTRNLEFSLTDEQCKELFGNNCYYCGAEPTNSPQTGPHSRSLDYKYNGIDRVNNDLGYRTDNVVTCCWDCNRMKLQMTQSQFYDKVKAIYDRHVKDKNQ